MGSTVTKVVPVSFFCAFFRAPPRLKEGVELGCGRPVVVGLLYRVSSLDELTLFDAGNGACCLFLAEVWIILFILFGHQLYLKE
jgi:hypothetical protein